MGEFPKCTDGKKLYPDFPVYKVILSECDAKPSVLHYTLLFPLLSAQQNRQERDQEKSSMEQEDTLYKGSLTHTDHDDVSDDEVSCTPCN